MTRWFLEGYFDDSNTLRAVPIEAFPFCIGRGDEADLTIRQNDVSRRHAELFETDEQLYLRDLGSTNGTFVNHKKITTDTPIVGDDVIHFAHIESRLSDQGAFAIGDNEETVLMQDQRSNRIPLGASELKELIDRQLIEVVFQPVVDADERVVGYEILGRGCHAALPRSPGELFRIAESIGLEVELSELFRSTGLRVAIENQLGKFILVNMHPSEIEHPKRLIDGLENARVQPDAFRIVLEIHEQAVTNLASLQSLADELAKLDVGIAYDDFGAGQARLIELSGAPPEIVKFDIELIRDIDTAPQQRQKMLKILVSMVHHMGVKALAEGVSHEGEANFIKTIGFDLIQGYHFGKPMRAGELKSDNW